MYVFGRLWVCLNQRDETVRSVSATTESAMNVNKKVVILGGCRHGKLSGKLMKTGQAILVIAVKYCK